MNIHDVDGALAQAFGRYTDNNWQPSDPLDELIQTVLGQRTTKAHARRALAGLKGQCRTWSDVAATPFDILADQLRPAGLARHKAIEAATPDRLLLNLHVNLIRLGRRHCGLSRPDCPECPISDLCLGARLQPDGVPLPHAWQR